MSRKSGITIEKDSGRKKRKSGSVLLGLLRFLCVLLAAFAWWNAFLSVFPAGIGKVSLFTALTGIILVLFALNLLKWKWRIPAMLVLLWAAAFPGRALFSDLAVQIASEVSFAVSSGTAGVTGSFYREGDSVRMGIAAALAFAPVLELWILAQKSGRGKILSGILMTVPFLAAACAGFFPEPAASWLLLLAGGGYFACRTDDRTAGTAVAKTAVAGKPGAKASAAGTAWMMAAGALVLLGAAALLSSRMGALLDRNREVPGGYYQTARTFLTTELVGAVEEMLYGPEEQRQEQQTEPEPEEEESVPEEEQPDPADALQQEPETTDEGEDLPSTDFTGQSSNSGSSMEHLRDLKEYVPSDAVLPIEITMEERPAETVYYPVRYGLEYRGDSWEEITEEDLSLRPSSSAWGAYLDRCRTEPEGLDQLSALCEGWRGLSADEVSSRIDRAFSELAVYDTRPGAVPDGQDFVEYFLFENHRGFCVHFASAATLLYRMSGYTAAYVEGYAVPPSAFAPAEDGTGYTARVDGTMGHAWCQTFDENTSEWTVREHTPASSGASAGTDRQGNGAVAAALCSRVEEILPAVGTAVAVVLALAAAVALQAAFRRKRKDRIFRGKNAEKGIAAMYRDICRTAVRQGMAPADPYGEEAPALLAGSFPILSAEEWEWLCSCAVRNLFYHLEDPFSDRTEMYRLYTRFIRDIYAGLTPWKRFLYKYIYIE